MHNFHTQFREKSEVKILSNKGLKHVVMLYGGMSAEREVSISSAEGVGNALVENGYRVTAVDMGADVSSLIYDLRPDCVFNCLHGTYGEDGRVPAVLDLLRIPYTHAGVLSSALAFNKIRSREVFLTNNINCAKSIIVKKSNNVKTDPMPRPYVIKPINQGSSVGVQIIFEEDNFSFEDYNFEYGPEIIVEKYIKGRELQIAVLDGKALGVLEIKVLKTRFYDYVAKYTEGFTEHILPAKIPDLAYKNALEISEKIFALFNCRGLARVEMLYCEQEDKHYVLEINTHPGMTPLSICPEIAAYNGISYKDVVKILVESAKYDVEY